MTKRTIIAATFGLAAAVAGHGQAGAQSDPDETVEGVSVTGTPHIFLEVGGAYGFQFGETQYVPDGMPGDSRHPLTNGFGFNAASGARVARGLDVILDYGYGNAASRSGT